MQWSTVVCCQCSQFIFRVRTPHCCTAHTARSHRLANGWNWRGLSGHHLGSMVPNGPTWAFFWPCPSHYDHSVPVTWQHKAGGTVWCSHVHTEKISEKWFQHLVPCVPWGIKAVLKAKASTLLDNPVYILSHIHPQPSTRFPQFGPFLVPASSNSVFLSASYWKLKEFWNPSSGFFNILAPI